MRESTPDDPTPELSGRPEGVPHHAMEVAIRLTGANMGTGAGIGTGLDWGWLWVDCGRLIFEGQNSSFLLKRADFKTKKALAACWSLTTPFFLRTPRGFGQGLFILPMHYVGAKPVFFKDGVAPLRSILAEFESQSPPFDESLFPPIERSREPMPLRAAVIPALQTLPAGIPIAGTMLCVSHMVPGDVGRRLDSPALLILVALFLPLIMGMSVLQAALTGRAYDGSIRKEIAKAEADGS